MTAMLQGVPWFLLGSLWAVLFCEYRAFRRRLKLSDHIRALESELNASEEHFDSERAYLDRLRGELLELLAAAEKTRAGKTARAPKPRRLEAAE